MRYPIIKTVKWLSLWSPKMLHETCISQQNTGDASGRLWLMILQNSKIFEQKCLEIHFDDNELLHLEEISCQRNTQTGRSGLNILIIQDKAKFIHSCEFSKYQAPLVYIPLQVFFVLKMSACILVLSLARYIYIMNAFWWNCNASGQHKAVSDSLPLQLLISDIITPCCYICDIRYVNCVHNSTSQWLEFS